MQFVDLGQQADVVARIAPGKRRSGAAVPVLDAPAAMNWLMRRVIWARDRSVAFARYRRSMPRSAREARA
jgi:hypothetical protein